MNREEFTQQFGEEALDLFEGYLQFCQSARAIAQQLKINHGICVTAPSDQASPDKERETNDQQALRVLLSSAMTTPFTQEANGPIMTGCLFLDEDQPIEVHLENGRLHDGARAYSVVSCQVVCWSFRPGWTREVATEIGKALDVQYHEGVFSISGITEQNLERSILRLVNAMLLFLWNDDRSFPHDGRIRRNSTHPTTTASWESAETLPHD